MTSPCRARRRSQRGSAVVDVVLVIVVVVPLVLGIIQLGLTLYVRNTLAAAAAEGARAAAVQGAGAGIGSARTREQISGTLSGHFAEGVTVRRVTVDGVSMIEVRVHARVPALGLGGPAVEIEVAGHAVEEPAR